MIFYMRHAQSLSPFWNWLQVVCIWYTLSKSKHTCLRDMIQRIAFEPTVPPVQVLSSVLHSRKDSVGTLVLAVAVALWVMFCWITVAWDQYVSTKMYYIMFNDMYIGDVSCNYHHVLTTAFYSNKKTSIQKTRFFLWVVRIGNTSPLNELSPTERDQQNLIFRSLLLGASKMMSGAIPGEFGDIVDLWFVCTWTGRKLVNMWKRGMIARSWNFLQHKFRIPFLQTYHVSNI